MTPREVTGDQVDTPAVPFTSRDLILHGKPNWTAVFFFCFLCALHLYIAIRAFANTRWEGFVSGILGCVFLSVAVVCYFARTEMTIAPAQHRIRVRSGLGGICFERQIAFRSVHAVRLTLSAANARTPTTIEILCDNEDIACPPTSIPRQEALYLALVMGVRLIKVYPSDGTTVADQTGRI